MTSYPLNLSVLVVTVMFEYPSEGFFSSITNCSNKVGNKTNGGPRGLM